jgi:Rrf2 family nitric oxide-sensitive transcriptional repressor
VAAECFSGAGSHCVITRSCRLKGVLGEAVKAFYAVLDRYTLADIVGDRDELATVLFVERPKAAAIHSRAFA